MSKKDNKNHGDNGGNPPPPPPPPSPSDDEPPLDDYGIDHDRILEICEKIIEKLHTKYVIDDFDAASATEYREVIQSLESCWNLTRNILGLDDIIYSAMEAMSNGNKGFGDIEGFEGFEDTEGEDPEIDGE